MTPRERFHALMNFRPADRLPRLEWAPWWDKTLERWHGEGLPPGLTRDDAVRRWFGLEEYRQFWPRPRSTGFPEEGTAGFVPVRSSRDYERIKPALFPEPSFDPEKLIRTAEAQAAGREVVWLTLEGFFWFPRTLFGIEGHLYAFYDHPDLMDRMNEDLLDWQRKTLAAFCRYCTPDFITLAEDMTYNHGPMIGRELFDCRLLPWYRRILPEIGAGGILPFADTDGNVHEIIPWLMEAGFRGCLPLERQAGCDPARIRRENPEWLMIGGINKMLLSGPPELLRTELEGCADLAAHGGYIPGIDHQTPPEVSLDRYRRYLAMTDELFTFPSGLPGPASSEPRHTPGPPAPE